MRLQPMPELTRIPTPEQRLRWRIETYGLVLAVIYAILFVGLYRRGWWLFTDAGRPILSDFTPMWLAGREALSGHAAAAYDHARFAAAQEAFVGPSPAYYPWPYPPIFFLPAALLALMPYGWAFVVWEALTLAALLRVTYSIIRERAAIIAVLASPFVAFNAAVGQNGFLTAALAGGALVFLEEKPLVAGSLLGCLTYKPQFALVLPLAFAVSRNWRALGAAVAAAALLAAISVLAFGLQTWQAFPAALLGRASSALIAHAPSGEIQSLYSLMRNIGVGPGAAWGLQIAVFLAMAGWVLRLWRRRGNYPLKAAAATVAALLASPYLFAYDMLLLLVAAAFLVADQIERGCSRGEQAAIVGLFCAQFAYIPLSDYPIGFLLNLLLFALILWRARRMV